MAKSPLLESKETAAKLTKARESLILLGNQIKAGKVDSDYWPEQLDEMESLLGTLAEEHRAYDHQQRWAVMFEVSRMLGSSLELDVVLNQAMDAIIKLTDSERGFLMLFDELGKLEVKVARNLAQETLHEDEFAISRSVIKLVAEKGEPVSTTNASSDPRFSAQSSVIVHKLRSIQCVPLRVREDIIGVVYVDNRVKAGVFDVEDLDMLTTFAAQAAMAIDNARLFTMTDEALRQRVEELSMLQKIDQQLNETLNFSKVMGLTLSWAIHVTGAQNGAIGLIDLDKGEVRIAAQHGEAPSAAAGLLLHGEVQDNKSNLTVPIQREGRVIGVIALDRKDGGAFSSDARSFVHRLADHAAIAIENTQLYEAVKRANDAKSEFVSVMTHELRVPMTSIKGYTEMIPMIGALTDQQKGFLDIILSNVSRMSNLVSDLSDISRLESGRLKIEIANDVSITNAVDEVVSAVRAEIESREHKLVVDIPEGLPEVSVDPQRLNQILTNLISNAYKYTPNGGTITIRAALDKNKVRIEVQDTGVGMSPEEMGKLFAKFWRADDTHVRQQQGTGLGLAIARNLVELQGGEMKVESQKGEGAMFWFTIPVSV